MPLATANQGWILRILFNGVIMAGEMAAIVACAWLGYKHPYVFAALTALLCFVLGARLEIARLRNELTFYFGRPVARSSLGVGLVAAGESLVKALVAGLVALLMFSGTDQTRLFYTAIVFGVTLYAGSAILRRLTISFAAVPTRWGFFRLAPPLGLMFSLGLSLLVMGKLLPEPSLTDIVTHAFAGMAARPSIDQVSELLYLVKQYVDNFVLQVLTGLLGEKAALVLGVVLSVNALSGFVIAIYAVVIAGVVCRLEDWNG